MHYINGWASFLKIEVKSAKVVGCGCYRVHSGRTWKGQSAKIPNGVSHDKNDIGFKKIRSVSRESCWS